MEKLSNVTGTIKFFKYVKNKYSDLESLALKELTKRTNQQQYPTDSIKLSLVRSEFFDVGDYLKFGLNIPRNKMPQIQTKNLDKFLIHFSNKYGVKKDTIEVGKLKPTQNEVNMSKVNKMIENVDKPFKDRFYLVSNDNYVADGHHGILASLLMYGPEHKVNIYKTKLPIKKLLTIMNKLKISFNKNINEKVNTNTI